MATGPIPKRSDEKVRRNVGDPIDKVEVIGSVKVPELGLDNPHPLVEDLYRSMTESAQARFFEPTDWQIARFTLDQINKELNYGVGAIPAMKLTAFNQLLASLLVTEGDRRRARIEIERKPGGPEGVVIDAQDQFKQWLDTT
ncbi:phage terminase small subunit [Mycobacteroides salmoniphilum]|uniref:phage terminase small subunit n=1 Tax=Mycobacteroides salmoniphilum TaxID=404941 RepID=UPI000993F607|nr:hypothetical protein [Mycobacteroides salmoniphilum]